VSGLAQGIDSVAHAAALDGGAPTIAVLGCGIAAFLEDIRGRRRTLAYRIRERGALVSQFPNDAPAQMWTFAKRNATIAALGVITVIVEAPAGSGALITAAEARTIARPVYAVPGPIGATASTGTNGLIASGEAHAVTSVSTVLQALGVRGTGRGATVREEDARVLDALAAAPSDPDALGRRLGLSAANLATIVARLAVRGLVATAPDGRLERR
jgi:DNA processing protein